MRYKMKNHFFILLFLFIIIPIFSQSNEPEKIVDNFFESYKEKGIEQAVDYLFSNNPILYNKVDSIKNLKNTLINIEKVLGKYKDYYVIHNKRYYDSLQIILVFVKYEYQPLRYLFVFYKSDRKWITYRFEIDTKYPDNFIDEIIKQNNINLTND